MCVYIYICSPPCAYIFLSLQGDNTAFLRETEFLGEEEKPQTVSNFRDVTFPISSFPTFSDISVQLPNFPTFQLSTFQLSSIPTFQHSNFPIFWDLLFNFFGLALEFWKVGKLGPKKLESWKVRSKKVGKLERWAVGILECWKVGKLTVEK